MIGIPGAARRVGLALVLLSTWAEAQPAPLLYTDPDGFRGWVLFRGAVGEQRLMGIPTGAIVRIALGPDGALYFTNGSQDVSRWNGGEVRRVWRHSATVRDLGFDAAGRLYFSDTGPAAAGGRIHRLGDFSADQYYTVPLAQMGGAWGGDFAFAPDGSLYLATGITAGSGLYRVVGGTPQLFYQHTAPAGETSGILGFDFDADGNLYYASGGTRIYRLSPQLQRTVALEQPGRTIADAHLAARSIALGPEAGRVNALSFRFGTPFILLAGSDGGGVFRSSDSGQSWQLRSRGLTDARIGGVLHLPPPSQHIAIAASASGIFRSTDEANSWTQVLALDPPLPPPEPPFAVRYGQKSPVHFNTVDSALYAAPFCAGLYRSIDQGQTWSKVFDASSVGLPPGANDCVTSVDGAATLYVVTPAGIYTGSPGGVPGWQPMTTGIDRNPLVLRIAPSKPDRLYVLATRFESIAGLPNGPGVWRRESAGAPFLPPSVTPTWPPSFTPMSLAVHPNRPDEVYLGTNALYRTLDGNSWPWLTCSDGSTCGADYHAFAFSTGGNVVYAAHDQGVFRLDKTLNSFAAAEAGLVNTQFYAMDVGPAGTVYAGTQDRGGFRRTAWGAWERLETGVLGDVVDVLADPTNDQHVFYRTSPLLRSNDGGRTALTNEGLIGMTGFWNHQHAYHPATGVLYAGSNSGVAKSSDHGATFAPVNSGMASARVRCLALAPGSDLVVYAGTLGDGIHKTTDGGATWTRLSALPESDVLVLTVTPAGDRVYAGTPNGVFVSSDGGATWSARSNGLPPRRVVSEIVADPACACRLYAGLGFYNGFGLYGGGVYQSADGGASWSRLSHPDETTMSVPAIRIDPTEPARLYTATHGSGIRVLLRNVPPASAPCACAP